MEEPAEITEQFRTIYYNNQTNRILPFLKSLKAKEKKEIAKEPNNSTEENSLKKIVKQITDK